MSKRSEEWKKAIKILKDLNLFKEPEPPRGPLAFGYARVSKIGQVIIGASMPRQREVIRVRYEAIALDYPELEFGETFEDNAKSAFFHNIIDRDGGKKLCRAVRPGDHVIFPYLDRAFRNARDAMDVAEDWNARNITMHFCDFNIDTRTPTGWLVLTQLAALAEYQSRDKSERLKATFKYKKLKFHGKASLGCNAPYGFRKVGKGKDAIIVPDPLQVEWGCLIVKLHDEEGLGWKAIADRLNQKTINMTLAGDSRYLKWRDKEWYGTKVWKWYWLEMKRRGIKKPAS